MRTLQLATCAVLLASAGVAQAQTVDPAPVVTMRFTNDASAVAFSQADCVNAKVAQVSVDYNTAITLGTDVQLQIFVTQSSSCDTMTTPPSTDIPILTSTALIESNRTGRTANISAAKLGAADFASCPANKTIEWKVCANVRARTVGATTDSLLGSATLPITYDSEPPRVPEITQISGGEKTLFLTWTGENVASWTVYFRPVGAVAEASDDPCNVTSTASTDAATPGPDGGPLADGGGVPDTGSTLPDASAADDAGADAGGATDAGAAADAGAVTDAGADAATDGGADAATDGGAPAAPDAGVETEYQASSISNGTIRSGSITGLINDQQYEVFVVATDSAGNISAEGNHVYGTPRAVDDFYKRYRCAGGDDPGGWGCSSTGGAATALTFLVAALALVLLRRRRA